MNLINRLGAPCEVIFVDTLMHKERKRYIFKTDIFDLKKGDLVLVNTVNGNHVAIFMDYNYNFEIRKKAIKKVLLKLDYSIKKNRGKKK